MKNAYLIVTDLHYAVTKEHRKDYFSEVLAVIQQVLDVVEEYKSNGYSVRLIFLGDVIDGPISQPDDAMRCQDLFGFIRSQVGGMYSVLGNHEEHNITDNPFWFLVSELGDSALAGLQKPLQPKGVQQIIEVPDRIVDGNLTLYFNHYGVPPKTPSADGISVGLFHQSVGSNDICKMWGTFDDVEQSAYVQGYNYLFFGHMHLAVGKYKLNVQGTCVGEWLGTCVGTTVTEVQALPSDLNIPAVLVEDGVFICVEDNFVKRSNPADVIDFTRLSATKAAQILLNERKDLLLRPLSEGTLFDRVKVSAEEHQLGVLIDLLSMGYDGLRHEYRVGLKQAVIGEVSEEDVNGD